MRNFHHIGVTFLALLCITMIPESGGIAVMSIDLGSEWLKIGIVKPGVPMEIALNVESKRKTPFAVSMKGDERLFGASAMVTSIKQPAKAFIYLSHLIGKKFESPMVQLYKKRFPFYNLAKDEKRGTVLFEGDDNISYSVEELVAMVLNNSKHIAEKFADHKMKDVVLTVPAYFKQAERRCLIAAAKMVGLNVLQLINDNAAVALNYGIFRSASFNATVKHIMFYDMGASHTTATIVGYSTVKVKDRGYSETVPQLVVKGVGFDTTLGGLEMDMRMRDHLVTGFREKYSTLKSDITKNPRAMAKLLKEARRVRQILSPNTETKAQIENLFEEKDFSMKVTRTDFETMCTDLFQAVEKPINMALAASSIPKTDIDSVILMGGGTRMPKVQEMLSKIMGQEDLGKSINTDEAAALGAVYKAASLMAGFKVKRFIVKDLNMFPVDVQFERSSSSDGTSPRQINRNLYHRINPLPQKKIMTFNKKSDDFHFNISYGDLTFMTKEMRANLMDSTQFANVKLTGVADAHSKNSNGNPKGVKAYYHLDESGLLSIEKVEAHFEKTAEVIKEEQSTLSKIGSKISDFFGSLKTDEEAKTEDGVPERGSGEKGSQSGDDKTKEEVKEKAKDNDKKADSDKVKEEETKKPTVDDAKEKVKDGNQTTATNSTQGGNGTEKVEPKNVIVTELITFAMTNTDLSDIDADVFAASVKKLDTLTARDHAKAALEKARNSLEGYISESREKLEQEEVLKISTSEEREGIEKLLGTVSTWFDDDGWDADEATLKKKMKSLKEAMKDINGRLKETIERPKAITAMLQSLNLSSIFTSAMLTVPDSKDIYSEKDVKDLEKVVSDTKTWFFSTWKKQNETAPEKAPVLLSKDIYTHQGKLDREVAYLINKAKYHVPKPKPSNTTQKANTTNNEKKVDSTSKDDKKTADEKSTDNSEQKKAAETESKTAEPDAKIPKSSNEDKPESTTKPEDLKIPESGTETDKDNVDKKASAKEEPKAEL